MKLIGTQDIAISEIDAGLRLREADPHWVEALAADIFENGQKVPVAVAKTKAGYRLIDGMNRLAAMSTQGETIRAEVFEPDPKNPEASIRMAEIDANLLRYELNPLDRGVFLARRKAVYEEMYPETKHGAQGGVGGQRNENEIFSFSKNTAERINLSGRAVERAVRIGNLPADLRTRLAGTKIAKSEGELYALTKLDPARQHKIVDAVSRAENPMPSVAAASREIDGHVVVTDDKEKKLQALKDAWNRAPAAAKKRFLADLEDDGLITVLKGAA